MWNVYTDAVENLGVDLALFVCQGVFLGGMLLQFALFVKLLFAYIH